MTAPADTDVPDTEQPDRWHRHRYLLDHGHQPEPCNNHCCKTEEST